MGGAHPAVRVGDEGKSLSKRLLSLLDLLNGKKKVNVPLIIMRDSISTSFSVIDTPWDERIMSLQFFSNLPNLSEERVIATLWNAFVIRACTQDLIRNSAILMKRSPKCPFSHGRAIDVDSRIMN
ncbi:hypothetical protein E5676_scaffold216G00050 [Cucumis melo var. makuwa]|uniref:Uncharacterized protein n=1 Tax=Cucumis melo var. makuwa TaxID=1194695 RepID=A0A5A7UQG3_CUCMM|nr:hypothetical protein E6C27_scaffold280G002090 [Cucumis melo var. makuwa]TYK30039.1 hypothetical protein E5676_scaffold216G00050 [Cucumis melo var. makuwa]